jgi:beta-lactamase superfamily II metal-dependent hydrolase
MEGVKDPNSNTVIEYQEALAEAGMTVNQLQEGSSDLHLDGVDIDVLNPSPDNANIDRNGNSVAMQATYSEQRSCSPVI